MTIMNLFRRNHEYALEKQREQQAKKEEVITLHIEYYPEANNYYGKAGNMFLKKNYYTGIVTLTDMIDIATQCKTEDAARSLCKLFFEQRTKQNVVKIKV